jgi:hypothetical protein
MTTINYILNQLALIDFEGKGESFIEARFLTPLLECLGYDKHKDYEVIRHGDEGSSFKLKYPPVEKGAKSVKHYEPDYIPTIRKKVFWIIEAKSPRDITYPFHFRYIVQGLQYCIHPEIQARYMVLSNGKNTSIYDSHISPFEDKNIYEPIFSFAATELSQKWSELYKILSVEKIRDLLEDELKQAYEKLASSSLDSRYPSRLLSKIKINEGKISHQIDFYVAELYVKEKDRNYEEHQEKLQNLDADSLFLRMNRPLGRGKTEADYFVEKSFSGDNSQELFTKLIDDWERQSIFRKGQTYVALCVLYKLCPERSTRAQIISFLDENKDKELNLLNQVECLFLRITRKLLIIKAYPSFREEIKAYLENVAELIKFVHMPTALKKAFFEEILFNSMVLSQLLTLDSQKLENLRRKLEKVESQIETDFQLARQSMTMDEIQHGGFEYYGLDRKHFAFRNIMEKRLCWISPSDSTI